ncbi:unnamed protein product [Notodromas monacha]|uniref:Uncharacterized protein n=1 Tax=Notodromas monacha TaxID=399045 RepID=A0A7R9BM80_9CRUS|nr:unnamed protein product [Notodromas monacha]CAG0917241.1 unnamed protein product [Notodromas monacha]
MSRPSDASSSLVFANDEEATSSGATSRGSHRVRRIRSLGSALWMSMRRSSPLMLKPVSCEHFPDIRRDNSASVSEKGVRSTNSSTLRFEATPVVVTDELTSFFADHLPRDYVDIPVVHPDYLSPESGRNDYRSLMDNPWKMTIIPGSTYAQQNQFCLMEFYSPNKVYISSGNAHLPAPRWTTQLLATLPAHGSHSNHSLHEELFLNKMSYNLFCLKVFLLLFAQVVFGTAALKLIVWKLDAFFHSSPVLLAVSALLLFTAYTGGICFRKWRRCFPVNLLMLFSFTATCTFSLSALSVCVRSSVIILAALGSALSLLVLIFMCVQFVFRINFPTVFLMVELVLGLIVGAKFVWTYFSILPYPWTITETLIAVGYWTWNLDLIMRGFKYEITKADAVYVAVNFYYDWLFMIVATFEACIICVVGEERAAQRFSRRSQEDSHFLEDEEYVIDP